MAKYINKDDFLQAYNEIRPYLATKVAEFTEILENFPTADVQPVKRGKWIAENRDSRGYADCYTCSNCQNYTYTYTLMRDCEYDYCPNCGADMRGENNG